METKILESITQIGSLGVIIVVTVYCISKFIFPIYISYKERYDKIDYEFRKSEMDSISGERAEYRQYSNKMFESFRDMVSKYETTIKNNTNAMLDMTNTLALITKNMEQLTVYVKENLQLQNERLSNLENDFKHGKNNNK